MSHWWITFEDRRPGCVALATREEALEIAAAVGPVKEIQELPYPANPRLDDKGDEGHPSFCWTPRKCAGRTGCPRRPSCVS